MDALAVGIPFATNRQRGMPGMETRPAMFKVIARLAKDVRT
jgi:hypothetical protein